MRMRNLLMVATVAMAFPTMAADRIPIADEGTIGDRWSLVPGTRFVPAYPAEYASTPEEVCVTVGYLLNADGHTSDFALLKSWSSGSNSRGRTKFWETFAGAASEALARWQFAPEPGVTPRPVYTAATFTFGRVGATGTREHCAIADLTTRLVELRYDARASRLMSRGVFSELDIDPLLEERLRHRRVMAREDRDQAMMANAIREQQQQREQEQEQEPPPPSSDP